MYNIFHDIKEPIPLSHNRHRSSISVPHLTSFAFLTLSNSLYAVSVNHLNRLSLCLELHTKRMRFTDSHTETVYVASIFGRAQTHTHTHTIIGQIGSIEIIIHTLINVKLTSTQK